MKQDNRKRFSVKMREGVVRTEKEGRATVAIRMPSGLKQWLEAGAKRKGRSLNQEIVAALELKYEAGPLVREIFRDVYGEDAREWLATLGTMKTVRALAADGRMTQAQADAVIDGCRQKIRRLEAAL